MSTKGWGPCGFRCERRLLVLCQRVGRYVETVKVVALVVKVIYLTKDETGEYKK
jgi:hypothetical protein